MKCFKVAYHRLNTLLVTGYSEMDPISIQGLIFVNVKSYTIFTDQNSDITLLMHNWAIKT